MAILFIVPAAEINNLYFDGSTTEVEYTVDNIPASTSITMDVWVYPTETPTGQATLIDHGSATTLNYRLMLDDNRTIWLGWYNAGWQGHNWPGETLILNQWNHVCGIIKPSVANGCKVYVNGTKAGEIQNNTGLVTNGTERLKVGRDRDDVFPLKGYMKNIIVYTDVDVPEATIIDHSNNDYSSVAGADLYWKLDEEQGVTAEDSTANNYDGTISNGTWQVIT